MGSKLPGRLVSFPTHGLWGSEHARGQNRSQNLEPDGLATVHPSRKAGSSFPWSDITTASAGNARASEKRRTRDHKQKRPGEKNKIGGQRDCPKFRVSETVVFARPPTPALVSREEAPALSGLSLARARDNLLFTCNSSPTSSPSNCQLALIIFCLQSD